MDLPESQKPPIDDPPPPAGSTEALTPLMGKILADIQPPNQSPPNLPESAVATTGGANPTQIGRYHVLGVIGEGGMGIVYKAEQRHPVRRTVALKLIKLGMDTRSVLARFDAERQVLALMNHANVARVFDAGITDTGRPFFVMEYVSGEPITNYCDRHRLSTRRRLELFRQACDAVHHAHQKAVIHRDIKPSNILVSVQDGNPIVKVIDFGVAKALNQRLTEHTLFTEQGQIIGTPEYMSPEQAEMTTLDIDIRTDVYSLGVVLYELLTGALPFDSKSIRHGGYTQMQQVIRDVDPPRPSTRLSQLRDEAGKIAANRSTDILSLGRELHSELEWVPLKAMRKDRTERYRSASELADDIDNYLHFRPLIAGPQTATYRVKKFIRKHRHGVAIAATLLVVFIAMSTALAITARRAIDAKNAAAQKQKLWEQEAIRAQGAEKAATAAQKLATDAGLRAEQEKNRAQLLLADLFEGRARTEFVSHRIEPALVYLSEAYQLAPDRITIRYALGEVLRLLNIGTIVERRGVLAWNGGDGSSRHNFSFSPDESRLMAFNFLGQSTLFNPNDGRMIAHFKEHFQGFSADSRFVVLGGQQVRLISAADGNQVANFDGKAGSVIPGQRLVTADQSGQFRVFDIQSRKLQCTFKPPSMKNNFFANYLTANEGIGIAGSITLKPRPGERWRQLESNIPAVLSFSADGERLVTLAAPDNAANIWETRTGRFVAAIRPARGAVLAAALDASHHQAVTLRLGLPGETQPTFSTDPQAAPTSDVPEVKLPEGKQINPEIMQMVLELWSLDQPSTPQLLHRADFPPNGSSSSGSGTQRDTYISYNLYGAALNFVEDKVILQFGPTGDLQIWRVPAPQGPSIAPSKLFESQSILAVSNDGKWALGTGNNGLALWNIDKAKIEHSHDARMSSLVAADFRADGKGAYTLESDGTLSIWGPLYPCPYHANEPQEAHLRMDIIHRALVPRSDTAVSPNTKFVVAYEPEGLVHITNPAQPLTGQRTLFTEGNLAQLTPDRRLALLQNSADRDLFVLKDLSSGRASPIAGSTRFAMPRAPNTAFSPDGSRLALISRIGPPIVAIVDTSTGAIVSALSADLRNLVPNDDDRRPESFFLRDAVFPLRLIFSPNSKVLAVLQPAAEATSATILDVASGAVQCTVDCRQAVSFASFSPDASSFIASTPAGVSLFDSRSATLRATLETGPALAAWTNSTGSRLLVVTAKGPQVWDTSTLQKMLSLESGLNPEFSPDGRRFINCNATTNRTLNNLGYLRPHPALYDAATGELIANLPSEIGSLSFNADSTLLLGVSYNSGATIWNTKDGSLYAHIQGERQGQMQSADFTPNQSIIHVRDSQGSSLWSVPDGRLIKRMGYESVQFSADGKALISGTGVQDISIESRDPATVRRWMNYAIPLRLSGLEIVKATAAQQSLAEAEYLGSALGWSHPQALKSLIAMISDASSPSDLDDLSATLQRLSTDPSTASAFSQSAVDAIGPVVRKAISSKKPQVAESLARSALRFQIALHGSGSRQVMVVDYFLNDVLAAIGVPSPTSGPAMAPFAVDDLGPSPWLKDVSLTAQGNIAHVQAPIGPKHSSSILFSDAPKSRLFIKVYPTVLANLSSRFNGNLFASLCGARVQIKGILKIEPDGTSMTLTDANDLQVLEPPRNFSPRPPLSKFMFQYNFNDDPGDRNWIKVDNDTWEEHYPDGRVTRFKVTSTVQEGLHQRAIVRRQTNERLNDNFEVFIPPAVDGAWFQCRYIGAKDWDNLARIRLKD